MLTRISDAVRVFLDFRYGLTDQYRDAHTHSTQGQTEERQQMKSCPTSDKQGNHTITTDATYLKSIILSQDDPRIRNKTYHPGDKFILKDIDETFSEEIASLLGERRVILEVLGYALTYEGEIVYDMITIDLEDEYIFRWVLSDQDLEESFFYLGDDYQQARFILIDA